MKFDIRVYNAFLQSKIHTYIPVLLKMQASESNLLLLTNNQGLIHDLDLFPTD